MASQTSQQNHHPYVFPCFRFDSIRFHANYGTVLSSVLQGLVLLAQFLFLALGRLALGRSRYGRRLGGTRRGFLFPGLGLENGRNVNGFVVGRGRFLGGRCRSLFLFLLFSAVVAAAAGGQAFLLLVVVGFLLFVFDGGGGVDAQLVQNIVEVVEVVFFRLFFGGFLLGLLFLPCGLACLFEAALPLGLFLLGFLVFFLLLFAFFFFLLGFVTGLVVGTTGGHHRLLGKVDVVLWGRDGFCDLVRSDGVVDEIFVIAFVQVIIVIVRGICPATHGCLLASVVLLLLCELERKVREVWS
mmetsp:Transcript_1056/g.2341  ORF Transcript_1056/g.2341 Transcript_1056/m.2341 type:complete len:298 (-) Transcript_1056:258-1151(-)